MVLLDLLADEFYGNLGVAIGKIEATKNEIEDVPIENFPTVKFFIRGRKKEAIEYKGTMEKEAIINFVKEHST